MYQPQSQTLTSAQAVCLALTIAACGAIGFHAGTATATSSLYSAPAPASITRAVPTAVPLQGGLQLPRAATGARLAAYHRSGGVSDEEPLDAEGLQYYSKQSAPIDYTAWTVVTGVVAMLAVWAGRLLRHTPTPALASAAPIAMMSTTGRPDPTAKPDEHPLDPLIKKLRAANYDDLKILVAENISSLGAPFFLRLAELSDNAGGFEEKVRLSTFSTLMMNTVQEMYASVEKKIDEEGTRVQNLILLCAEEDGEFMMPLADEKVTALRAALQKDLELYATDPFVACIRSYMKKASEDKMDALVGMLQKVLQYFGAEMMIGLCRDLDGSNSTPEAVALFQTLLKTEEDTWDATLAAEMEGGLDPDTFVEMINTEVGSVLFQLPTGSAVQQVCAEYASEILSRVNALRKTDDDEEEEKAEA